MTDETDDRSNDDVPREWTRIMKNSMRTVNAEFNTNRMVEEYTQRFYVPCLEQAARLAADEATAARDLSNWRAKVAQKWDSLQILDISAEDHEAQPMGSRFPVQAVVDLVHERTEPA